MFTLLQLLDAFPSPVTSDVKHSERDLDSSKLRGHKCVLTT